MIDRAWPRIAAAVAVSGAVHAALISAGHIALPETPAERAPLALTIERVAAAPQTAPAPPRPRRARTPPAIVIASAPAPAAVASAPGAPVDNAPPEQALPEAAAAPAPEPTVIARAEPSTFSTAPRPLRTLPRRGEITYTLVYGAAGFPIGRTIQTWQIDGSEYRLASASETTGLADLFRSQQRDYVSRGVLTADGLRPEIFVMSRSRGRGLEESRAEFDWNGGTITFGSFRDTRREALPRGSVDILSLAYQLALDPPQPGRLRLPVTNGNKLETYDFDVLPEESIETPLGVLRALPIKQLRKAGEESIEVWLAMEYRYLPVRVRFIGRDGHAGGEQIVRQIKLSEE